MNVLMSINPEYANAILDGRKKYELRKVIFKNPDAKKVVIYCTAPVSKIIGEFEIGEIICDTPSRLWEIGKDHFCVQKTFFNKYFEKSKTGYAIEVKTPKRFDKPILLKDLNIKVTPPQSFCYIEDMEDIKKPL